MLKGKAPVILGLLLTAGVIAAVTLVGKAPSDNDLLDPSLRYVRDRYAALGHKLGPDTLQLTILSRKDPEGFVRADVMLPPTPSAHLLRLRDDGRWRVDTDMFDDFDRYLKREQMDQYVAERFRQIAAQKLPRDVEIKRSQYTYRVDWSDRPVGYVEVRCIVGQAQCLYVETYACRDGAWSLEGVGQWYDHYGARPQRK